MWPCYANDSDILLKPYIEDNLKTITDLLLRSDKINVNGNNSYNFTNEYLETGAKMFIYWNLCPKFMLDWAQFYKDLLQNASPDIIVLTLNRIMVAARKYGDSFLMNLAKNIFMKLAEMYSFHFHTIDAFTKASSFEDRYSNMSKGSTINCNHVLIFSLVSDTDTMLRVSNHPVHIVDVNGNMSPSSFIPFCMFGGDKNLVGHKDLQFSNVTTVCKSFQEKILNDQLCYEVDLGKFAKNENIEKDLKLGFSFIMDYNEDRQVSMAVSTINEEADNWDDYTVDEYNEAEHSFIYLNTVGTLLYNEIFE